MPKVCVVTLYRHNYGAFLQAYALQRFLERAGFDAELLNYDYYNDHAILGISVKRLRHPASFAKTAAFRLSHRGAFRERERAIGRCVEASLLESARYRTYGAVKKHPPKADVYMTGSDQVWNPTISEQGFLSRLLDFAPNERNVLCSYAASAGVPAFSDQTAALMRTCLARFDKISVREPATEAAIRPLTDREIVIHRDPVLLLPAEDWDGFAEGAKTERPYIFIYLAQKDPELVRYAIDLSEKTGFGIVDCHGSINYSIPNCVNGKSILSPTEFVGGIKNAAYVVTNSFHCLAFSIHYHKKAYVKLPPKGAGRLSELIGGMSLQRLLQPEPIRDGEEEEIYTHTADFLRAGQEAARAYLAELSRILAEKRR